MGDLRPLFFEHPGNAPRASQGRLAKVVAGIVLEERFGAAVLQNLLAAFGVGEYLAHHAIGGLVLLFTQREVGDIKGVSRQVLVEILGKAGKP